MKGVRRFVCLLLVLLLFLCPAVAADADAEEMYRQQLEASGASELSKSLPTDVRQLLEQMELDLLDPESYAQIGFQQVLEMVADLMYRQSQSPLQTLWMLLGVVLICAWIGGMEMGGGNSPLYHTYQGVAVLGAGTLLMVPLVSLLDTVGQAVERVTVFLGAYVPAYAAILATSGRGIGALSYQTTLLGAVEIIVWLMSGVVFPVLTVSLAFGCTGAVTDGFCLDRFSAVFHKTVLWALGLISTLFSGLLSLQQMVTAAGDSLGVRVARFSLSSFVPVVGGLLSEAYTTVMGCAGLLRSVMGGFGLVAVALMVLPPLLCCIGWHLAVQLAGGAAALFGLTAVEKLCAVCEDVVRVLIALLAVFALLMVVSTAVMGSAIGG